MPIDRSKFTHDAYIFKSEGIRKGRPVGYWQQEGVARIEPNGDLFVYLHSTPIGGFNGRIMCRTYGAPPPEDKEKPQRPGEDGDEGEGNGED